MAAKSRGTNLRGRTEARVVVAKGNSSCLFRVTYFHFGTNLSSIATCHVQLDSFMESMDFHDKFYERINYIDLLACLKSPSFPNPCCRTSSKLTFKGGLLHATAAIMCYLTLSVKNNCKK